MEKPAPNGWYDTATGKIYIDLYAGQTARGTMLFTIAHELTHFIRQNSPEKIDALADIVVNKSNLKGKISERIEQKMNEAEDRGEPISRDTAYEEVIADSMETCNCGNSRRAQYGQKAGEFDQEHLWRRFHE